MSCPHCHEAILESDQVSTMANGARYHQECLFRMIAGSAAHIYREMRGLPCGGEIGKPELCDDDPMLSLRQAAKAALELYQSTHVSPAGIDMYGIFEHPEDAPDKVVLRRFTVIRQGMVVAQEASYHDSVHQAREALPAGLSLLPRFDNDPPFLVETWF